MNRFSFTILSLCLLLGTPVWGQNEADALRHSQTSISGTARSLGMGGAFSAVGADITSAHTNPAGLGVLRSSTFAITPVYRLVNNSTNYIDQTGLGKESKFNIGNWGVAFNTLNYYDNGREKKEVERGLKSYTFAFGQNQIENYTREVNVSAFNEFSTIGDMFVERANGLTLSQLPFESLEALAFETFAIDTLLSDGRTYFPAASAANIQQTMQVIESGRRSEWFIALGANFSDKLYIGGSIGIQSLRYEQTFVLNEDDVEDFYFDYNNNLALGDLAIPTVQLRFTDEFSTRGTGFNGKFGIIYRPIDPLRVGLSIHTPTFFTLTDDFSSNLVHVLQTTVGTEELEGVQTPGRFEYNLQTPYKVTLGVMYLIQKSGFISADIEMTDISSSQLSTNGNINSPDFYSFAEENQRILDFYKRSFNARLGGEFRSGIFRLRAGTAFFGNPLTDEAAEYLDASDLETVRKVNGGRRLFTLGAGIRQPNLYLDVSLINQQEKDKFTPYTVQAEEIFVPSVVNTQTTNTIVATVGFTF